MEVFSENESTLVGLDFYNDEYPIFFVFDKENKTLHIDAESVAQSVGYESAYRLNKETYKKAI